LSRSVWEASPENYNREVFVPIQVGETRQVKKCPVKKKNRRTTANPVSLSPEFLGIKVVSQYLGIQPSTLYCLAEEQKIPHYRIGRLIRFKRSEIDAWMDGNKRACIDPEQAARKALGTVQKPKIDIDRIVRKAIDGTRGQGYTTPHGKPDQVKGLGKEVKNGTL